jgi:fucose permease
MNGRTKFLLLTTGIAGFVLLGLAQAIFGPVLPAYAQAFGLPISTVGWVLSVFWAGSLAAVAAVYALPAHLGPKTGLLSAAAGTALLALMSNWAMVLAGAALFGFGYGVIAAVWNPRVLAAFGPRGPAMMSLMNALFTLGAIAAPQVFLALGQNPSSVFWVFAAYAVAITAATLAMGDTRTAAAASAETARIDWSILGFAFLGIGLESSVVGLGPTGLVLTGETPESAARLLSAFFIAYLLARLSLVLIAHRIAPFVIYTAAVSLLAALTAAAMFGQTGVWFPLMGFASGYIFHGEYLTGLRRMGGTTRVSAILLAAGMAGAIVLPVLISQLLAGLGPKGFFQIILGIALTAAVLAALNLRRLTR